MTEAVEYAPPWDDEGAPEAARAERLRERLQAIVGRMAKDAEDRVSKRELIEKRWLTDLAQYHGKYEDRVLGDLTEAKKSTLFINQTRSKTHAMEARLSDMLFPTDDRNWGILPTPVPEMTIEAEESAMRAASLKQQAAANPNQPQLQAVAQQAQDHSAKINAILDEARKRSRSMEEEIADHLKECKYSIQAREVIRDACKLGTGVMKGPVTGGKARRAWQKAEGNVYQMKSEEDPRPVFWRVDPWAIFPDPDATSADDCESWFERHLMNEKQLRKLARSPGFDADGIRRLLKAGPQTTAPSYIADLRNITGAHHDSTMSRYHVWEYHGPLSGDDMQDLAILTGKNDLLQDIEGEIDPLDEMLVQVWFCQGEVIKFGIHHLDSGDSIYSVFCLEKDETSLFGFGIPYIMRDAQKSMNAAWRTMMDNAGLSSGPQIEIDQDILEPANGVWALEARKLWLRKPGANPNAPGIRTYNIDSHQAELSNIVEMSRRNIDEETNISILAQGEQGSHTTQTAHGMNLLMNATNVVFRRIVKNFDDDMTTPNIRRMYDFLMQFSRKEHIKGDYEVDARGTSVLLVREMQSANLMAFLINFSAHPTLAGFLKDGGLPALRRLVQTMMIPADEVIKTDDDLAEEAAAAASQPPMPDPNIMKLETDMNAKEMEWTYRKEIALINRETEMMKLAANQNMKLEELRERLGERQMEHDHQERRDAAEAAMTERAWMRDRGTAGGSF